MIWIILLLTLKPLYLMKKLLTGIALVALFSFGAKAQTTNEGQPASWNLTNITKKVMLKTMPAFNLKEMVMEDKVNDKYKVGPWRFGKNFDVNYSTSNSGQWDILDNGDRIWRIAIASPGAISINLIFDEFHLPPGAKLYMYSENKEFLLGAYTDRNNRFDHILGTELVDGESIVVEYYEPAAVAGQGNLRIGTVTHAYRSVTEHARQILLKGLNDSGDCNIDTGCPLGTNWTDQIKSVAMIVVNGNGSCTGALVNNTLDDGTPYFLTANHCLGNLSTWAFRFNWESPVPSCATTTPSQNGPVNFETANGATLRASNGGSDFALVQIDNLTLNDAQNWNLFYAGWDNTDAAVQEQVGIHHPSGDVKKISRDADPATQIPWNGADCWEITAWDEGTTEPGSSGSPLFDQNQRIIGQLFGGQAACSGVVDNDLPDYYGRFGVSWNGASASERLHDWLDPSTSGATTNDGYDPNAAQTPDDARVQSIQNVDAEICGQDMIFPTVEIRNNGTNTLTSFNLNYELNATGVNTIPWTGSLASLATTTVSLPAIAVTDGSHSLMAATSDPNGNTDTNPGNDSQTINFDVTTSGQWISFNFLAAAPNGSGSETSFEIIDAGSNVVYSGGPMADAQGPQTETFCLGDGCYDLVVYDSGGDGIADASGSGTDGSYALTDAGSNVLLNELSASFGASETQNFCITGTAVPEYDELGDVNIYPNPTNGEITIDLSMVNKKDLQLNIYNSTGAIVRREQFKNARGLLRYSLADYAKGLYFIEIRSGDQATVRKVNLIR
jgi:lysyl endopeptidase